MGGNYLVALGFWWKILEPMQNKRRAYLYLCNECGLIPDKGILGALAKIEDVQVEPLIVMFFM